jgi:calcineurin-like phosphoesterase family protein
MSEIYFSSDLHFGHDKDFIYRPRGFSSINEMNEAIIERFNSVVKNKDILYLLGDVMLGNNDTNIEYLKRLNGHKVILTGNHDTNNRLSLYYFLDDVDILGYSDMIKYKKKHFYLSHYPTITSNMESNINQTVINLYGHTHQKTNFYENKPFMYHVGVDSHNCYPISIDTIIEDIKNKIEELKEE